MKRVELVVERDDMNSTRFDEVREWGNTGCLEEGVVSMLGWWRRKLKRALM
jgi:hypothetical protein